MRAIMARSEDGRIETKIVVSATGLCLQIDTVRMEAQLLRRSNGCSMHVSDRSPEATGGQERGESRRAAVVRSMTAISINRPIGAP